MAVTLAQARLARQTLAELLSGSSHVNGIGIVRSNGDYGLKVNLTEPGSESNVPPEVDGVHVEFDVTGPAYPA